MAVADLIVVSRRKLTNYYLYCTTRVQTLSSTSGRRHGAELKLVTGAVRAFMQHGTTWQLLGFRLHVGFLDASNNLLMVVENNLLGTCTDFHFILMDDTEVFIFFI